MEKVKKEPTPEDLRKALEEVEKVLGIVVPAYIDGWNRLESSIGGNRIITTAEFRTSGLECKLLVR